MLNPKDTFDTDGFIIADRLVQELHITKVALARAVGLSPEAVTKKTRVRSISTQSRLRDTVEILLRVQPWAGSTGAAWAWYRSQPIPSLGDLTAEQLVTRGEAEGVRAYLDRIGEGGYA